MYSIFVNSAHMPTSHGSHILYAFADINPESGEVFLSDKWADQDIHYPGDSWNDQGTNLYGNFKAIYNLKKKHRHLKVLLSIGGWTYSPKFHNMIVSKSHRETFASSAIKLLEDYGLDGLDVDYEYPQNDVQAEGYVELLKTMRHGLDKHAQEKGANYRFLLTVTGSWDKISNHQANVYGGPIGTSTALAYYESHGVPRSKMVLGIPCMAVPSSAPMALAIRSAVLAPAAGNKAFTITVRFHSHIPKFTLITPPWQAGLSIPRRKRCMFWELSGDKGSNREGMEGGQGKDPQPGRSLVKVVKEAMGELDDSPNWLHYERSKFDNMKQEHSAKESTGTSFRMAYLAHPLDLPSIRTVGRRRGAFGGEFTAHGQGSVLFIPSSGFWVDAGGGGASPIPGAMGGVWAFGGGISSGGHSGKSSSSSQSSSGGASVFGGGGGGILSGDPWGGGESVFGGGTPPGAEPGGPLPLEFESPSSQSSPLDGGTSAFGGVGEFACPGESRAAHRRLRSNRLRRNLHRRVVGRQCSAAEGKVCCPWTLQAVARHPSPSHLHSPLQLGRLHSGEERYPGIPRHCDGRVCVRIVITILRQWLWEGAGGWLR
ncbi:glycoside hydrolase family protein [Salix suchowensis]|nr:glycoside hydrolase family protein [Salix suchowensis]